MLITHMCSSYCHTLSLPSQFSYVFGSFTTVSPPPFSDWNLCLALSFLPYAHYIFRTTRMCIIQQLLLDSSTSLFIYIRLIILKVTIKFQDFSGFPGPVRSLHLCYGIILDQVAFIHWFLGCRTTVFLKVVAGKYNPVCTLPKSKT